MQQENERKVNERASKGEVKRRRKRKYSQRFSRHVFEQFSFNLFSQQTDESNMLLFLLLRERHRFHIHIKLCSTFPLVLFLVCSRGIKVIILKHNVRVPIEILLRFMCPQLYASERASIKH